MIQFTLFDPKAVSGANCAGLIPPPKFCVGFSLSLKAFSSEGPNV